MPSQSKTPTGGSETSSSAATSTSELSQRISLRQKSLQQQEEDTKKAVSDMLSELERSIRSITQDAQQRMLSDTDSLLNQHQQRLDESLEPLKGLASRIEQQQQKQHKDHEKWFQKFEKRQARVLYRVLPGLMIVSFILGALMMYQILNR